ncbi:UPF0721 transmembrane protein [Spirochaetia bacterium]|nr:UPF0721 transmembrane protein [Spirochaetia bacterium]
MIHIVSGVLILLGIVFLVYEIRDYVLHRDDFVRVPWIKCGVLGFFLNALNVWGIGSFATLTAGLRLMKQTEDKKIPGTLNVSCVIPVILQAVVFIRVIQVDPLTLVVMFIAAGIGSFFGAGIVAKLPEQKIRLAICIALFVAAFLMLAGLFKWLPGGGEAYELSGIKLIIAAAGNCILGALMTVGVGLYGPCMALVYFLGMSSAAAYPIMMGSCAFLLPIAGFKFVKTGAYDRKVSLVLQAAGSAGILIAIYVFTSIPLNVLRWIVIGVLLYTSVTLLLTYVKKRESAKNSAQST